MGKSKKINEKFQPFNLVVFGGSGDLALRKIYPAMFQRFIDGQLTDEFNIVAVTRKDKTDNTFYAELRKFILASIEDETDYAKEIADFINYVKLIVIKKNEAAEYAELVEFISPFTTFQNIFYFSTPSSAFGEIGATLKEVNLVNDQSKVVLEKPLGFSLKSSAEINEEISKAFTESQVYRIDHYLGKETVQNLMVLRFTNNLFAKAWDADTIDNIQITVAENLGVEGRAGYYDNSGALRDMIQNHLLQLLCLVAMEPPNILGANEVRDEKLKVLKALRPLTSKTIETHSVKGQYTRGKIDGKEVSSYLEGIEKYDSKTETYVALKAFVDNWRWKNVPFYLRTGKRMKERYSEIVINFKAVKHNIFPNKQEVGHNKLIISLQPDERIELVQMTKIPGPGGYRYQPISLKLDYSDTFKERFPDAYERLLIDVIRGNQTLFMRQDELQAAWKWTESISDSWNKVSQENVLYEAGSWGPKDKLMEANQHWETKKSNN